MTAAFIQMYNVETWNKSKMKYILHGNTDSTGFNKATEYHKMQRLGRGIKKVVYTHYKNVGQAYDNSPWIMQKIVQLNATWIEWTVGNVISSYGKLYEAGMRIYDYFSGSNFITIPTSPSGIVGTNGESGYANSE
jgi:hypothetical protein